jgi:DNA modification methylase
VSDAICPDLGPRGVLVLHGDATALPLPDASVDAVVCDPPYALPGGFMGQAWDRIDEFQVWCETWAREAYRVLKPGGHLLAFGGTRTAHRLVCGIEDAGFEIRDTITWIYASGFPKSLDVSKAIDRAAGAEREIVGLMASPAGTGARVAMGGGWQDAPSLTAPATDDARRWSGWGTALKPASEPIVVARKPLAGTVAANILEHGTGALNIDGCRVQAADGADPNARRNKGTGVGYQGGDRERGAWDGATGRWPSNVVWTHAPDCDPDGDCTPGCPVAELDAQAGVRTSGLYEPHHADNGKAPGTYGQMTGRARQAATYGDSGGASRFFPVFRFEAKAPSSERPADDDTQHPTVKPVDLMRWLIRLVTPPGGRGLDMFAGSGTTGEAALLEGFDWVLVEKHAPYLALIRQRLEPYREPATLARARGRGVTPRRGRRAEPAGDDDLLSLLDLTDAVTGAAPARQEAV